MYFFQHDAGHDEAQAMYDCVMRGDLTTGKTTQHFIEKLQARFGFGEIAVSNSGTSSLFLALKALGIGPGDEVITTPYVGVWTSNPILMVGATPVYADIEEATLNLDPVSVQKLRTSSTKAVMPVSVNGVPFDYVRLRAMTPPWIAIVGDDIEALGSKRNGQYVGADLKGNDLSVNGFWVSKQVTTCTGGMVTGPNTQLVQTIARLSRHGHGVIGDMWDQNFGYNMWLPDPLAAMGCVQIDRFEEKQDRLMKVEQMLDQHFIVEKAQTCPEHFEATKFIYLIKLPEGVNKKAYADEMAKDGIPTRPYFNSLTEVPHLREFPKNCPTAEVLSKRTIALPFHWKLTEGDVLKIADVHGQVLARLDR